MMTSAIVHDKRTQDWILGAAAAILFVSPWLFRFDNHSADWSAWLSALGLAYLAAASLFDATLLKAVAQWEEWATAALGLWLILAPEVLKFSHASGAQWTHWLIGCLVVIVSLWAQWKYRHPLLPPRH